MRPVPNSSRRFVIALTTYATPDDLQEGNWLDAGIPENADRLLRYATIRVARACNLPVEDVSGDVAPPLRDATCAQVAFWVALGIDPAKGGTDLVGPVKRSVILGAHIDRDVTALAPVAAAAATGLCQEALDILFVADLLWLPGDVEIADGGACLPEAAEGYSWSGPFGWPYF